MKMVIEEGVFDENIDKFKQILQEDLIIVNPKKDNFSVILGSFDRRHDNFFYGSIELAEKLRRYYPRAVHCNLKNYECTYYYPRFEGHLLNNDFIMLPFGSLNERVFDLFNKNLLFLRPNEGSKNFSGQALGVNSFYTQMSQIQMQPEELVLVSSYKNVGREWRLMISEGKVITGSQYKNYGEFKTGPVPQEVVGYAEYVLAEVDYDPDLIWSLDICEYDGYHVLEVGAGSCSGLYDCDIEKFIEAVKND